WSSQARGFFTGRFTPEDRSNEDLVRVFYNADNWERYRRAEQLGQKKGVETIQISLAYVLNQSFPTAAIIGPQNKQELVSCGEAAELTLTEEETTWLDLRIKESKSGYRTDNLNFTTFTQNDVRKFAKLLIALIFNITFDLNCELT